MSTTDGRKSPNAASDEVSAEISAPAPALREIARRVKEARQKKGWSVNAAAKQIGISDKHLKWIEDEKNSSILILLKVVKTLGIKRLNLGALTLDFGEAAFRNRLADTETALQSAMAAVEQLREDTLGIGGPNAGQPDPVSFVRRPEASKLGQNVDTRPNVEAEFPAGFAGSLELVPNASARYAGVSLTGEVTPSQIRRFDRERHVVLVPELTLERGDFAFRVVGESFADAGIHDGDTLIVERRTVANDGELVLASAGGKPVIARSSGEGEKAHLVSADSGRRITARSLSIEGIITIILHHP